MTSSGFLRALGARKWNNGEAVTSEGLLRTGMSALATVLDLFVARHYAIESGGTLTPTSGTHGDDCLVTVGSGTREVDVAEGVYWINDSTITDVWSPAVRPCYVEAETLTLSANASGSDRVDLVCVEYDEVDADSSSRRVRMTGPGTATTSTLYAQTTWVGTLSVVEGTPGAGTPSTPSGKFALAACTVASGGTTASVVDVRILRRPGNGYETIPDQNGAVRYARPLVQSGCAASAGGGTREIDISAGVQDIGGTRRTIAAKTVTLSANASGNPRIDLIYSGGLGGPYAVVTGTAAAQPEAPTLPGLIPILETPIAYVQVASGATSFVSNDITDARWMRPLHHSQVGTTLVFLRANVGPQSGGNRALTITAIDADGNDIAVDYIVRLRGWTTVGASSSDLVIISPVTTGTELYPLSGGAAYGHVVVESDSGVVEVDINNSAATTFIEVSPIDIIDATTSTTTGGTDVQLIPATYRFAQAPIWLEVTHS